MASSRRARFVALASLLTRRQVADPTDVIANKRVLVDGRIVSNPASLVRSDAAVRVLPQRRLRGEIKLSYALGHFDVPIDDRVAVDLGASAGGFTSALLARGARRVYAVEVGTGQLLGRLRLDDRVVNLEGHNLGSLDSVTIPEQIQVLTLDLGYLPLVTAISQVEDLLVQPRAHLVALVKPTFELRRSGLVTSEAEIDEAMRRVVDALEWHRWSLLASCRAPTLGRGGAREMFLHACRRPA